jgi:hypothetical protein
VITRFDRIHALMPAYAKVTSNRAEQYRMAAHAVDAYDMAHAAPLVEPRRNREHHVTVWPFAVAVAVLALAMVAAFIA